MSIAGTFDETGAGRAVNKLAIARHTAVTFRCLTIDATNQPQQRQDKAASGRELARLFPSDGRRAF